MNRRENIETITKQIIENLVEESRWNDKLLEPMNREEFEIFLKERSDTIRKFFSENEILYGKLREYAAQPLDEELADALYEAARAFYLNGRLDPVIICEIADPVVDYYMKSGDEIKAIIIIAVRNSSRYDYFNRMDHTYKAEEFDKSYKWILSRKDRYTEFEDIRARRNILFSYLHLISIGIIEENEESIMQSLNLIDEANELWNRPEVQAMDGNDQMAASAIGSINSNMTLEFEVSQEYNPEIIQRLLELFERYCEQYKDSEDWSERFALKLVWAYKNQIEGVISSDEALKICEQLAKSIPETDWEDEETDNQQILIMSIYMFLYCMRMIKHSDISYDTREIYIKKMFGYFKGVVKGMPFKYLSYYVDDMYRLLYQTSVRLIQDMEFFDSLTVDLLMSRQISTYLHTRMVESISSRIAETIIEKEPELFAGIPGYPDVDSVRAGREALLLEISRSARYHDLGKSTVTPVITRQSRKITDDEFACIKLHPKNGVEYIKNKEGVEMIKAVMLGHHKTYDGKGGYPYDFDNTASEYRIIIDLITISDCTDAATDITGRNYAKGKNFLTLLEELKQGAGTRYNPDIVRIIDNSPELIADLCNITGEKRMDYCYEAYSRCSN